MKEMTMDARGEVMELQRALYELSEKEKRTKKIEAIVELYEFAKRYTEKNLDKWIAEGYKEVMFCYEAGGESGKYEVHVTKQDLLHERLVYKSVKNPFSFHLDPQFLALCKPSPLDNAIRKLREQLFFNLRELDI